MSLIKGERHGQHALTDEQIRTIRLLYKRSLPLERGHNDKYTIRRLASMYDCSKRTIEKIIKNETYQWVK